MCAKIEKGTEKEESSIERKKEEGKGKKSENLEFFFK